VVFDTPIAARHHAPLIEDDEKPILSLRVSPPVFADVIIFAITVNPAATVMAPPRIPGWE